MNATYYEIILPGGRKVIYYQEDGSYAIEEIDDSGNTVRNNYDVNGNPLSTVTTTGETLTVTNTSTSSELQTGITFYLSESNCSSNSGGKGCVKVGSVYVVNDPDYLEYLTYVSKSYCEKVTGKTCTETTWNGRTVAHVEHCECEEEGTCIDPPSEGDFQDPSGYDPTPDVPPTSTPVERCYYCKITDTTGVYTIATSASEALTIAKRSHSDAKSCQVDSNMAKCDGGVPTSTSTGVTACYRCKVSSSGYMYTKAKSATEAATITKGVDCTTVAESMCKVPTSTSTSTTIVNPPTGGTAIIIAWIIGIFAIVYSVWYFSKNSELEKK